MAQAIYFTAFIGNIISASFHDAHELLKTTSDGFNFLDVLLIQAHPKLAIKLIVTILPQKCFETNILAAYA